MPLDAFEIRILAEFARFVDKENIARTRIRNALTLDEGHLEKSGFVLSRHEHKKAAQRRLGKNPCATV
jgi:hypothetical protein